MKIVLLTILFLSLLISKENQLIKSDSNSKLEYEKLNSIQSLRSLEFEFNKGVLKLENKDYVEAINTFKKTANILKVPSFLNIGIAYYNLESFFNAQLYLNKIYEVEDLMFSDTYSYLSATYYLYKITKDDKYLDKIQFVASKVNNLSDYSKNVILDVMIIKNNYKKALEIIDTMSIDQSIKKSILYLLLGDYVNSELTLNKAEEISVTSKDQHLVLWIKIYRDLKANELEKLLEDLDKLNKVKSFFKVNEDLPLKVYFNANKYTPKQHLDSVVKFDDFRKIDFVFYLAPYVFSDNDEIIYDMTKGFIFKSKQNIESLEKMVEYNSKLIELIKQDPIIKVRELKKVAQYNNKSYIYYNLALAQAQIYDFDAAYENFHKAYKLNPGNKLYAVMTLISAKRIYKKVPDESKIVANIISENGYYRYFGQNLLKLVAKTNSMFDVPSNANEFSTTSLAKAITYLKDMENSKLTLDNPLLLENYKDPIVYLLTLSLKRENESDYEYFSRLQDNLPLELNENFLDGNLLITDIYFDLLKGLGLYDNADLYKQKDITPTYLRTKVLKELYNDKADEALKILEFMKKKYNYENRNSMYLEVAALLQQKSYDEASVQISLINAKYNDSNADYLTGVQLIQELKIPSASLLFKYPYNDNLIDFKLDGLEELLLSL